MAVCVVDICLLTRFLQPDDSRHPITSIASLKVTLEEVPFTPPKTIEELPILGTPNIHQVKLVEN